MRADADFFCQPIDDIQVDKDEVSCNCGCGYKIFFFILSLLFIHDFSRSLLKPGKTQL